MDINDNTFIIYFVFFYSLSSSEVTSSSSERRENTELPTILQQAHAGVTSTSHYDSNTLKFENLPHCYSQEKKNSVKSVCSNVSNRSFGNGSRHKADRLIVSPRCHEQSPHQYSGWAKLGINVPENHYESASNRSHVRAKVSWVWGVHPTATVLACFKHDTTFMSVLCNLMLQQGVGSLILAYHWIGII